MPLIELKNISKLYDMGESETVALKDVSFSINAGEFTAIMGPSGSGKSTLLHILGLLDKQSSGEYLFDGKSANDYSQEELARLRNKKMGFIFQSFSLLPKTTVFDNVKLPLLYSKNEESLWESITTEAIKSVGLEHRMHHESSQLSGGERQRVAIARALVNNPEIIFADEPTGNLDSKSGGVIMEILEDLNKNKKYTILLITHETYTASYAGRIIKLRDGKIESDKKIENQIRNGHFVK